ncbi:efflux RND transporter permease subunit [Sphingomicrobium aestuariivivum]|uniref:efflux RND transporter permease subunit n=1 Tax=Sphingomicrobium aestuariivivum TaxID=1582356 RepID=UPI001FD690B7|nr:efflux RND transporter permease subunit [Sphingomicrobium aestuariivivum]MCJ8191527.1 efflux RND transporter permease subunit [Sphingomicrobium aestuariivivum]
MNFRRISEWSIRNPVPPIVLFTVLLLAGVISFLRMEVTNNPDIDFPAANVTIILPSAAPEEIENQITQRVEAAVRGIEGVDEINSSVNEGSSNTFVQFEIGTDTDRAVNDVRDAISQVRGSLPQGILEPRVSRVDISGDSLSFIAARTTDMTLEELSWYIDNDVNRQLLGVEGIAEVERYGGVDREIRVILDPRALQAQGLTAATVNNQLRQLNINAAGGRTEIAGSQQSVRVLGNAETAAQLGETQIATGGGRTVRLRDIATVRDASSEQTSYARMNGEEVVVFNFSRAKGASDVTAYDMGWEVLAEIEENDPRIDFIEISNNVEYTKTQYKSSMQALIEGALLAVLVVFLFLRDLRATIIAAVAIPLSAIPAFFFMDLMSINLNFLSLLALALVAGVLVDDAIVEIENIVRHMRMGKSAWRASIDAADEIGLAVLATTATIVAVFLPVALMPGISGQFFKNFGYTVVLAVIMSLLVARMITPLMAAYFLKAGGEQEHANGRFMQAYMKVLRWTISSEKMREIRAGLVEPRPVMAAKVVPAVLAFGLATMSVMGQASQAPEGQAPGAFMAIISGTVQFFGIVAILSLLTIFIGWIWGKLRGFENSAFAARSQYRLRRIGARLRDHRMAAVAGGVATILLTVVLFAQLPMQFSPQEDRDTSSINVALPPGATIEQTAAITERVAATVEDHPQVENVFQRIFTTRAYINVVWKNDRPAESFVYEREISPELAKIPDARVNFQSQGGGGPGGSGQAITFYLGSSDPELLEKAAYDIAEEMSQHPQLVGPRVVGDDIRPEIQITPRFDLAADLGVTTASLSQTIRIATIGEVEQNSAKFSLSDRQIPVSVSLSEQERENIDTLLNLPVPTSNGGSVPLKSVADISFGAGPTSIQRTDQQRRIAVGTDFSPDLQQGEAWAIVNGLESVQNLPRGVQRLELGEQKWQQELLFNFVVAVAAGVMLVFAVLVLLYRRFLAPFVNMGSLLLAPLGAAVALNLAGMQISLPVFIGLLMLLGIVAKNSILLVDFALEMMNHGMEKDEAIAEAGHKRAQPIVMTTVAMVAGMIPIALSLHGDGSWRAPMGASVIGGLIFSTALTLLLVPAYYSLAIDMEKKLARKFGGFVNSKDEAKQLPYGGERPLPPGSDGPALPAAE